MPKIIKNGNVKIKTDDMDYRESFSIELDDDDVNFTVVYLLQQGLVTFARLRKMETSALTALLTKHYRDALKQQLIDENNTIEENDDDDGTIGKIEKLLKKKQFPDPTFPMPNPFPNPYPIPSPSPYPSPIPAPWPNPYPFGGDQWKVYLSQSGTKSGDKFYLTNMNDPSNSNVPATNNIDNVDVKISSSVLQSLMDGLQEIK